MNPERAKYLKEMEIGGILFCSLYAILAGKLYELSGKGLIGVLFGSVNNSPWECIKPLLLSYLLWGILEALSLQPSLHRLAAVKTAALYLLTATLLAGSLVLRLFGLETDSAAFTALCLISLCICTAVSLRLFYSELELKRFFAPCVFLLFLFLACYFSLTPFPLKNIIFMDSKTGLYGLIPEYFDMGAYYLS